MNLLLTVGDDYAFGSESSTGLTTREYMATHIMQGLVANPEIRLDSRLAAKFAVRYANHLIEELNNEENYAK